MDKALYSEFCFLSAAAILLATPVESLIQEIGHDGREIVWPEAKGLAKFRNFHIQEITDCFMRRGIALVPCYSHLISESISQHDFGPNPTFSKYLEKYAGIIVGESFDGALHATAWFRHRQMDFKNPSGVKIPEGFYAMIPISQ